MKSSEGEEENNQNQEEDDEEEGLNVSLSCDGRKIKTKSS